MLQKGVSRKDCLQDLHDQLGGKNPNPVMVTGTVNFLLKKDLPLMPRDPTEHEMVIAGRRFKDGKCELLLRNSWGRCPKGLSKNVECDPASGKLWVDEDLVVSESDLFSWAEK